MNKLLLKSGLILTALGLVYWAYNQYTLAMKYCYKIKDIKFNAIGMNRTNITVFMLIRNFSNIKATINSMDLDVYIGDKLISKVKNSLTQTLNANSVSDVMFDIEFSAKELFKTNVVDATKLIGNLLTSKDKVVFKFKGTVSVKIGMFNFKNINIDIESNLKALLASDPNAFICDI